MNREYRLLVLEIREERYGAGHMGILIGKGHTGQMLSRTLQVKTKTLDKDKSECRLMSSTHSTTRVHYSFVAMMKEWNEIFTCIDRCKKVFFF